MPDEQPELEEQADAIEADDHEAFSLAVEEDRRDRRWIAALTEIIKVRVSPNGCHRSGQDVPTDDDLSPRVRRSLDDAIEAACGRLCRILNSDIDTHEDSPR